MQDSSRQKWSKLLIGQYYLQKSVHLKTIHEPQNGHTTKLTCAQIRLVASQYGYLNNNPDCLAKQYHLEKAVHLKLSIMYTVPNSLSLIIDHPWTTKWNTVKVNCVQLHISCLR